ncbi:hypothetical protein OB69_12785 [Roseivirga seohaensis subsp. aquiponti]|uniref:HEPN AbiU2-like domain-containing protein n=1 Tax=Roseivirga seohaensis subsp. aquiponti TaxID=1566026 RepID=A0A0L8AJ83_9BACT|nr:hypothetical protein [Roseivirga seohaensis]KOF02296.1 hypothetical protein OB69_12785 [Roseivirga seohaensis subsp. aquiponti]
MVGNKLKEQLQGIRFEVIDLNQAAYFFIRKMNRFEYILQKTSREFVLEELYALRYLENGLILHLTKLDDDNSIFSFRAVLKELNRSSDNPAFLKLMTKMLKDFRQKINKIKIKHRNARIAHITTLEYPNLDEFLDFNNYLKPLIEFANTIADAFLGEQIQNKFKLGTMEGTLDFRESFKSLRMDLSSNKDFS